MRTMSNAVRRLELNESYFSSKHRGSSYWAGFLLADGCVQGNAITLALGIADHAHILAWKDAIASQHSVTEVKRNNVVVCHRICVHSTTMCKDLEAYGVIPKKSKVAAVPEAYEGDKDYWRGVIDGDGYIRVSEYPEFGLVGSKNVCDSFAKYVTKITGANVVVHAHKTIFSCAAKSRHIVARLCSEIYGDAPVELRLTRKYQAAIILQKAYLHELDLRANGCVASNSRGVPYGSLWETLKSYK